MKTKLNEAVSMGAFDFVANVAIHARVQMGIRSLPIMLVVEFAKILADYRAPYTQQLNDLRTQLAKARSVAKKLELGDEIARVQAIAESFNYENMRRLVCDVIQRADQITDLYAYALEVFGGKGKVPMAVKRGVADAFNKFNEYHFGKYDRAGSVKFRDVLRIVHPTAKNEKQGVLFEKIMKETLATPYTWETELSKNGQLPKEERRSEAQVWTDLLESGKLGYMALRSNVRNIIKAGVDDEVIGVYVASVLADPKRVVESKQFPFSFIQARNAIQEVGGNTKIRNALDKALELSCRNIPMLGKKLALIIDKSGSMVQGVSTMPGFTPFDQAVTLAAMVVKAHADADDLAVIVFGSAAETLTDINPNDSINSIANRIRQSKAGGGTQFDVALHALNQLGFKPDAVLVMTDGEINKLWIQGTRQLASIPSSTLKVVVNFQAANTTPFPIREGWYPIAGWSDKVFKWIPAIHQKVTVVDALCAPYAGAEAMKAAIRAEAEETEE